VRIKGKYKKAAECSTGRAEPGFSTFFGRASG
jgi:hypothetical protein